MASIDLHPDFLDRFCWIDHEPFGGVSGHAVALELFRDKVIAPSLVELEATIDRLQASDDELDAFVLLDIEPLHQTTMEGYALAVQSMFERSLRGMLQRAAASIFSKDTQPIWNDRIRRATWSGSGNTLKELFTVLIGFPLRELDPDGDLDLLQELGSAMRHGDGRAAETIHRWCPELWINWLPPGYVLEIDGRRIIRVRDDAPAHPSIDTISFPRSLLEQMILAILWFWRDIEYMRCRSFRACAARTVRHLDVEREDRRCRASQRVWSRATMVNGASVHASD